MENKINNYSVREMTDRLQQIIASASCESNRDWDDLSSYVLEKINEAYDLGVREGYSKASEEFVPQILDGHRIINRVE